MRFNLSYLIAALIAGCVSAVADPLVDLGYARYQGYYDSTYDLNVFKGIRYAAPPIGRLRWQAPAAPLVNNSKVTLAQEQPPLCPQSGVAQLPAIYGFTSGPGDEDCLFLNVYAPPNANGLPVMFWIHGGAYGLFGAVYDPSVFINTNGNGFIFVEIQYRLGAFGFLSSDDVHKFGQTNAGLLDQRFAMEWVQKYISKFGGDPSKVTIGGESAGASSVMYHAMAYGGKEFNLFQNIIAASPYLAQQYNYNDPIPTGHYTAFATAVGCADPKGHSTVFDCLVAADTTALQNASGEINTSGAFGTVAFLPVTDGNFIQDIPSHQLQEKRVSGKRILAGNNANDGVPLSNPNLQSREAFVEWIKTSYPNFTQQDVDEALQLYGYANSAFDDSLPRFDTLGNRRPTALNESEFATGLQQTLFDVFAEASFACPAAWLSDAFSGGSGSTQSWKYQYSVTPAYHGADLTAYFAVNATTPTAGFRHAFQKIWGNFVINNTPVISIKDAKANASNATVPVGRDGDINWPTYTASQPVQMNLNTTGGTLQEVVVTPNLTYYLRFDPGVVNVFELANAYTWEAGRGARCDFWRKVGNLVPA